MQTGQRDAWRERGRQRWQRLARDLRRLGVGLALLLLGLTLFWFLFPPFWAPRTHLVLVGTGNYEVLHAPPIPFVAEDLMALETVDAVSVHNRSELWQFARRTNGLGDEIRQAGLKPSDTLIVYLSAHGISDNGTAYLLCDDFDLRRPSSGRVSVPVLLEQISKAPASAKVLLLNAGSLDYDPRLGMVINEFPQLLERAVKDTADPSLWVYSSHSALQRSHITHAAQRSVFGMFVAEGLRGAADLDNDLRVDLGELASFVSSNVTHWVRQSTNRGADQTPQLIWGGGSESPPGTSPQLLALNEDSQPYEFDIAKLINLPDQPSLSDRRGAQDSRSPGVLTRRHLTLAAASEADLSTADNLTAEANGDGHGDQNASAPAAEEGNGATDKDSSAEAEGSQDSEQAPGTADPSARPRQLLAKLWQLRDQGVAEWSPTDLNASPIENLPHLWREFQAELIGFEQRLRGGTGFDLKTIQSILEDSSSPAQPPSATGDGPTIVSLLEDPSEARADSAIAIGPHSLALFQIMGARQPSISDIDVTSLYSTLDQDDRKGFDAWMQEKWQDNHADYYELRFLKALAGEAELDWSTLQLAAKTCLNGERIAALDLLSPGWLRADVERADQSRFFAEELIFDKIGINWQERIRGQLTKAADVYAAAESHFHELRRAQRLKATIFDKAPHYVRWYREAWRSSAGEGPHYDDLTSLLSLSAELIRLLDKPDVTSFPEITRLREDVESVQARIELAASDASIARRINRTPAPGDAWQAEVILKTPLLSAATREGLLGVLENHDRELAAAFQLAKSDSAEGLPMMAASRAISLEDWDFLLAQARLEAMFVALCPTRQGESSSQAVMDELVFVEDRHQVIQHSRRDEGEATVALWTAYGKFGAALADWYGDSQFSPSKEELCSETSARSLARVLRMLDPRDAWRFRQVNIASISRPVRLEKTLRWQAERLQRASVYRSGSESALLRHSAKLYRQECMRICGPQATGQKARASLEFVFPSLVDQTRKSIEFDLQYSSTREFPVELHNRGTTDLHVCVSFDYDKNLIHVASSVDSSSGDDGGTARLAESQVARPINIAAGTSRRLRIQVERLAQASQTARLVIDALACPARMSGDAVGFASATTGKDLRPLARQKVHLILPVCELVVLQDARLVSPATEMQLLPYPNRVSSFKFGVVNRASNAKSVTMALHALNQPLDGTSPEVYSEVVAGQTPLAEFKMTAVGNGIPTFPAAATDEKTEDAEPTEVAEQDKNGEAPAEKAIAVKHGLVVAMRDDDTGQTTFRRLGFAVQRPRRFLQPRVGFNADSNRIEIEVSARHPSLLPSGDAVRVACRLANALPGGTEGLRQGLIKAPEYKAKMFINVPSPPPQDVKLYLDVDDYPRAFVFNVPCGKHAASVPEDTELTALRLKTSSIEGYLAATKTIPITLEVDAPVGSFEDNFEQCGLIEVGVAVEGTQGLDPTSLLRLRADRSVVVEFTKAMPDGTVDLRATVSDFQVDLPVERLENVEFDVEAHIKVEENSGSDHSRLFIDSAPPIVGPVNPTNFAGFAPVQSPLALSVWVWDGGSGVKQVEAVFDTSGTGEFPAEGALVKATQESDREWALVIPAGEAVGPRTLLVRGVDHVGNHSEPVKVQLEIVSLAEHAMRIRQQTVELSGVVMFRKDFVDQGEIKLNAVAETALDSSSKPVIVQTKENGRFRIPGVPPGDYVLSAKAVINNKVRRTERKIAVKPGPRTMLVDFDLP